MRMSRFETDIHQVLLDVARHLERLSLCIVVESPDSWLRDARHVEVASRRCNGVVRIGFAARNRFGSRDWFRRRVDIAFTNGVAGADSTATKWLAQAGSEYTYFGRLDRDELREALMLCLDMHPVESRIDKLFMDIVSSRHVSPESLNELIQLGAFKFLRALPAASWINRSLPVLYSIFSNAARVPLREAADEEIVLGREAETRVHLRTLLDLMVERCPELRESQRHVHVAV